MAFIVLALGAVMVLAGGYEIYFGSNFILIERGWSAFISGTVLATGGCLTLALGLAIRVLTDLKAVLIRQGLPAPVDLHGVTSVNSAGIPAFAPLGVPARERESHDILFDVPSAAGVLGAAELATDNHGANVSHALNEHSDEAHTLHAAGDASLEPEAATLDADYGEPGNPESELEHTGDLTPAMDDWLDRNFADLARDATRPEASMGLDEPSQLDAALPEPTHATLAEIERPATPDSSGESLWRKRIKPKPDETSEPLDQAHATHPVEEPEDPAPAQDPSPEPTPSPAVIGRYESEGTSYVMFADGSIEAQSSAGVYRFASMSELKSFIEG